jgi:hypothetical protein
MRALILGFALSLALATAALAQGYEYQPSGLEYQPTVPVEIGETVQGLIRLDSGMIALGQIRVEDVYYGDMFAYWLGNYQGGAYYYDRYSGYWKPGPVSTQYATLNFQGETVEGWVRVFGPFIDYDHFFGRDGVLYQRVNVTRARTRDTNRRRQILYTYFVNMETGERSDGEGLPYRVLTGDPEVVQDLVEQQMEAHETKLAEIVEDDPAYPQWETEAYEAPVEIVSPTTVPATGENTLLELMEGELEPLNVDLTGEGTAAEGSESATESSESTTASSE